MPLPPASNPRLVDALVIGHGLAGAVLTHSLAEAGWRVLVLDQPTLNSASRVAAGLVNPLAGRRFALTWRAEELLPAAAAFYQRVETTLGGGPWWYSRPIWKFFASIEEANAGLARVGSPFIAAAVPPTNTAALRAPLGGLELHGGGFLQTEPFLLALAAYRRARAELREEPFVLDRLDAGSVSPTPIRYQLADGTLIAARYVIFCEGAAAEHNPLFQWLPLVPNNGQVLEIDLAADLPPDVVLNGGAYAVPQPEHARRYRLGATYDWGTAPPAPTAAGQDDLLARLARFTSAPATVVGHRAGRRPAVRDRRPLLGFHPSDVRLVLFNGLGSKGVGLAPGLAAHLVAVLNAEETLWPEVNLARFAAFYPGATVA
ncbi:MAG: FAD-dependent oxidoreductase [Hymenobacteraceae bacterium]|nr:FAD-dependent oxidoreductase [Hymenobacteraceae bacterium]